MLLASLGLSAVITTVLVAALPQDISILPEVPCPFVTGDTLVVDNNSFSVRCAQAYTSSSLGAYTVQPTFDACLARCGNTPRCVAVNYNAVDRKCELKTAAGPTVTSPLTFAAELISHIPSGEDSSNELEKRQVKQPEGPGVDCPFSNGDILTVEDQPYQVYCDTSFNVAVVGDITTQPDFEACIARCGNAPACVAVNYNSEGHRCMALTEAIGAVAKPLTYAAIRAPASLLPGLPIPPSTIPPPKRDIAAPLESATSCIYGHGEVYHAGKFSYRVQCGRRIALDAEGVNTAGDIFTDIESCLEHCESVDGCSGVSFTPEDGWCWFFASAADTEEDELSWVGELIRDVAPVEEGNELVTRQELVPVIPCPFAADHIVSVGGVSYRRYCDRGYVFTLEGGIGLTSSKDFTMEDCLALCSLDPSCTKVNFEIPKRKCWRFSFADRYEPQATFWAAERLGANGSPTLRTTELNTRQVVPEGTQPENCIGNLAGIEDYDLYCDHHWEGGEFTDPVTPFGFGCMSYCNTHEECFAFTAGYKCQLHNKDAVLVKGSPPNQHGFRTGWSVAAKRKDGVPHPLSLPPSANGAATKLIERQAHVEGLEYHPPCAWNVPAPLNEWRTGGVSYTMVCDVIYKPEVELSHKDGLIFEECLDHCSKENACRAVTYDLALNPGRCTLWTSTNNPVDTVATWTAVRIESPPVRGSIMAVLPIKRQKVPEDVQPNANPQEVCSWANINFVDYPNIEVRAEHWDVYCEAIWEGGVLINDFGVADFAGCVVLCHYTQSCVAFTWLGPGSSNCVVHNADAKLVKVAQGSGVAAKRK